jgi:hypothetical protein
MEIETENDQRKKIILSHCKNHCVSLFTDPILKLTIAVLLVNVQLRNVAEFAVKVIAPPCHGKEKQE